MHGTRYFLTAFHPHHTAAGLFACDGTLRGWSDWLHTPRPDEPGGCPRYIADGGVFEADVVVFEPDVVATMTDVGPVLSRPIPADADLVALRRRPSGVWSPSAHLAPGSTLADPATRAALADHPDLRDPGDQAFIAVARFGETVRLVFHRCFEGARLDFAPAASGWRQLGDVSAEVVAACAQARSADEVRARLAASSAMEAAA